MKGKSGKKVSGSTSAKPMADKVESHSLAQRPNAQRKNGGGELKAGGKATKPRMDKRKRGGGIHIKKSHKGLLHRDTGTPAGEPIPEAALEKERHSPNPAKRKRAVFAENAKHFKHK